MSKIVRYEFTGNWLLFWFMCVSIIGIPLALLYLLNGTLKVEEAVDNPNRIVSEFRVGKWRG